MNKNESQQRWHRWFAWHPVRCRICRIYPHQHTDAFRVAFLKVVYRRRVIYTDRPFKESFWVYAL